MSIPTLFFFFLFFFRWYSVSCENELCSGCRYVGAQVCLCVRWGGVAGFRRAYKDNVRYSAKKKKYKANVRYSANWQVVRTEFSFFGDVCINRTRARTHTGLPMQVDECNQIVPKLLAPSAALRAPQVHNYVTGSIRPHTLVA